MMNFAEDKFSVILPTYNERKNLPVIVWLLAEMFEKKCEIQIRLSLLSNCSPANYSGRSSS